MKSLFFYLLQVVVVSGILYAYYHVALRNKKFHQYNRFYMLAATAASILIPFLNIPVYFSNEDSSAQWMSALQNLYGQPVIIPVEASAQTQNLFTWHNALYAGYALVALAGLGKILLSIRKLKKIMKDHPAEQLNGIRFINTAEPGTPFSFFRWLFWNNRIELSSQKGEQIFRHEVFHIEQKHSLDSIFMEMATIVFWINPFFHLMKKELKAIHEFLADRFATNETQKWEYAEMLLMQALNTQHSLVHPFFHNQIKRRIAMITNPQKTSHQYLRKLMVFPLAALLITLFAFSYKQKQNDLPPDELSILEVIPSADDTLDISGIQAKEYRNNDASFIADTVIVNPARLNGNKQEPSLIIFNNKQYSREAFGEFLATQGSRNLRVVADVVMEKPANHPESIARYGELARGGVLEFQRAHFDTIPAKQPVKIQLKGNVLAGDKKPLIVLDGVVKEEKDYDGTLSELKPENIESITVLKNATAENLYGPKAKDGVLLITTKAQALVSKLPLKTDPKEIIIDGVTVEKTGAPITVTGRKLDKPAGEEPMPEIVINAKRAKMDEVTVVGYGTRKKVQGEVKEVSIEKTPGEVTVVGRPSVRVSNTTGGQLDVEPAFPGGAAAWYNFLAKNLDGATGVKNGAPEGQYIVQIRVKVNKDGRLSDFKALTSHGFGMEEAAIQALEKSPYWNPGYKNNIAVPAYKIQPFAFAVAAPEKIALKEVEGNSATVFPNPVKDQLTIRFDSKSSRNVVLRIFDVTGKERSVANLKLDKGQVTSTISTAALEAGTYVLKVDGGQQSAFKFVKE